MGFSLSNLFHYNNATDSSTNKGTVLVGDSAKNYQVVSQIKNLMPGQNISGEVVGIHDNEVQIALDKDTVLIARLERNLNIALGQTLTFEVSSISKAQIALRPLFTNMANDPNLIKALSAAKIPVNESTISMVSSMMEQGMSIDKQSLLNMYKAVITFPQSNPASIVQLNQLKIPITEETIIQFEKYQDNNHQLLNSLIDISKEIPLLFQELVKEGKEGDAVLLYQKLIQTFTPNQMTDGKNQEFLVTKNPLSNIEINTPEVNKIEESSKQLTQIEKEAIIKEAVIKVENVTSQDHLTSDREIQSLLSPKEITQLVTYLEQMGASKDVTGMVKQGTLTPTQILQTINQLLEDPLLAKSQETKALVGSDPLNIILKSEIAKQWLLQPKDVAKSGALGDLYQKISEQTGKILEALSDISKTDSSLMKSVTNMQGNVDFMNQLNQMFNYVQLPLKLSQQNANGELYVYTNKRNLTKEDGNISAILHLDMDHLGTMDIYVTMKNKDVSTKFYLQDNATIDFINKHIHILDEKLEKRGYHMTSEMIMKEKDVNVIEEMLHKEEHKESAPTLLSKYSFDVRA